MKTILKSSLAIAWIFVSFLSEAQTSAVVPELVFTNPILISGTAGNDGAVYRYSNVAPGVDAQVKIKRRSSSSVVLLTLDATSTGWSKAFQPQLGLNGIVTAGKNWWMEFEMKFFQAGTNTKRKINAFNVTALDIDGDGQAIREYVQMNKVKSVKRTLFSYLVSETPLVLPPVAGDENEDSFNATGVDKKVTGPLLNFENIDTSATSVMATYSYEEKDNIDFIIGARSTGTSDAGMRLNSLWFKAFDLTPVQILPVKLSSFTAFLEDKHVSLCWTSETELDFSHYVVERSEDGNNFTDMAVVFGKNGTSVSNTYSCKDPNLVTATGVIYYRLRMVDLDHSFSYSPIQRIRAGENESHGRMLLYPNPVTSTVTVSIPISWQHKPVTIEIFSISGGKMLMLQRENATQTQVIELPSLRKGMYLLRISCMGEMKSEKFTKL